MVETIIVLSICLWLVAAIVVGEGQRGDKLAIDASELRSELRESNGEKESARHKAEMILPYMKQDREFRLFDDILGSLPEDVYRGYPHQHRAMEAQRFDFAARHLATEPCSDKATITALNFDAVRLNFRGREYTGWKRGEWVMVPARALG
jgi:hypothetical protein